MALGLSACEATDSPETPDASGSHDTTSSAETCVPGESFAADDDCNTCICPDSGLIAEAGCTKMDCVYDACAGLSCGA